MNFQAEIQKIQEKKIAPIYLVLGTEFALQERFKETLEKVVLQDPTDELNKMTVDLNERPLNDGLMEAESIPFFGERRLIFLENPWFLTGQQNNSGIFHDIEGLETYLKAPLETSVLVFLAPYEKLDERKKIVKALKKTAVVVSAASLSPNEIRQYARNALDASGVQLMPEAFETLLNLTAYDFSKLEKEIEKIRLYGQGKSRLTVKEIEALVPRSLQEDVFKLADYLLTKKTSAALQLYQDLILQGEEPIKLNGILISQFRLNLQIKILLGENYSQAQMASLLKVHPFRIKRGMETVRKMSLAYLGQLLDELIQQDFAMKQSVMDKNLGFEFFILKH